MYMEINKLKQLFKNRNPHLEILDYFMQHEIDLIDPTIVVCVNHGHKKRLEVHTLLTPQQEGYNTLQFVADKLDGSIARDVKAFHNKNYDMMSELDYYSNLEDRDSNHRWENMSAGIKEQLKAHLLGNG